MYAANKKVRIYFLCNKNFENPINPYKPILLTRCISSPKRQRSFKQVSDKKVKIES